MSEWKVKTRKDAVPQGKARVYFTCCDVDFDACFEAVTNKLLLGNNCAVYYDMPGNHLPLEKRKLEFSQIQMFTIAVSKAFFLPENKRCLEEVQYALKEHIPVLPLMLEPDLEEEFNRTCGELQILNFYDKDSVQFCSSFSHFLDAVLLDSGHIEKQIRESFHNYFFLSYRKPDREYAIQVMKTVHAITELETTAIWYDEFLVPGENFNNSIVDMLLNSAVFLMVVTPKLLEEQNYVLTTEFPAARRQKLPVIPIEVIPTDREELYQKFPGLPEVISIKDTGVLREKLLKITKNLPSTKKIPIAQREYLMGYAYLTGIDAEQDYEKAFKLISSAANRGYMPAIGKLSSMYRYGEGVSKDLNRAVYWLKRYVNIRKIIMKKKLSENPRKYPQSRYLYLEANKTLSFIYGEQKDFLSAEKILRKMHSFCRQQTNLTEKEQWDYHWFSYQLAMIESDAKKYPDAIRFSLEAIRAISEIPKEKQTDFLHLATSLCRLCAGCYESLGNSEKAEEMYQKAISFGVESTELQPDNGAYAISCYNKAHMLMEQKKFSEAYPLFGEAGEIYKKMVQAYPGRFEESMVISVLEGGFALEEMKEYKKAEKVYLYGIELLDNYSMQNKTTHYVNVYHALGRMYVQMLELVKAETALKKAAKIHHMSGHPIMIEVNPTDKFLTDFYNILEQDKKLKTLYLMQLSNEMKKEYYRNLFRKIKKFFFKK